MRSSTRTLKLVAANKAFAALRGYPSALCRPGTDIIEFYRFNAERGDYGPGDAEAQAMSRMERVRERQPHELEYELASGRILNIRYAPIAQGGLVLSYSDITERKRAERDVTRKEAQLHVALDNMPGALAYTDDELNIVFCNNTLHRNVSGAEGALHPGAALSRISCATSPSTATTARATSKRWSPAGSKACAIPWAIRWRIARRTAASTRSIAGSAAQGGTVTVITDITRLKLAEEDVTRKEAELHVALDNMPGALVYTDAER